MVVNLSTPVQQGNITKWGIESFDPNGGVVTVRFQSNAGQSIRLNCTLSDTAGASIGVKINATPASWDDRIMLAGSFGPTGAGGGGVGAAGSLTSARGAYVAAYTAAGGGNAAKHSAGLKAVELQGLTDGWIDAALTGT